MITYCYLLVCAKNNNWNWMRKMVFGKYWLFSTIHNSISLTLFFPSIFVWNVWRVLLTEWRIDRKMVASTAIFNLERVKTFPLHYKYQTFVLTDHFCNNNDRNASHFSFSIIHFTDFLPADCRLSFLVLQKHFPSIFLLHSFFTICFFLFSFFLFELSQSHYKNESWQPHNIA